MCRFVPPCSRFWYCSYTQNSPSVREDRRQTHSQINNYIMGVLWGKWNRAMWCWPRGYCDQARVAGSLWGEPAHGDPVHHRGPQDPIQRRLLGPTAFLVLIFWEKNDNIKHQLSSWCVPGTVLSTLHTPSRFIFPLALWGRIATTVIGKTEVQRC